VLADINERISDVRFTPKSGHFAMWRLPKTNPGDDHLTITATKWNELQRKKGVYS